MAACVNLLIADLAVGLVHIDFLKKVFFGRDGVCSYSPNQNFKPFRNSELPNLLPRNIRLGLSWVKLDAIWKADLTDNRPLEFSSHMSLSGLGVGGR